MLDVITGTHQGGSSSAFNPSGKIISFGIKAQPLWPNKTQRGLKKKGRNGEEKLEQKGGHLHRLGIAS